MPYTPEGFWEEPTDRVVENTNGPPLYAVPPFEAPRVFPYGLGVIPQISFDEDEAILTINRGDT